MRTIKIKFLEDFTYDSMPADANGKALGKTPVTIKKDKIRTMPDFAARNLIRKSIAKEV